MRLITAVVSPAALPDIRQALKALQVTRAIYLTGATEADVRESHVEIYRGREYESDLGVRIRLEVIAFEADVDAIVDAIAGTVESRRDKAAVAHIWVLQLQSIVRSRVPEPHADAIATSRRPKRQL